MKFGLLNSQTACIEEIEIRKSNINEQKCVNSTIKRQNLIMQNLVTQYKELIEGNNKTIKSIQMEIVF